MGKNLIKEYSQKAEEILNSTDFVDPVAKDLALQLIHKISDLKI
jgi:hypothetical protein